MTMPNDMIRDKLKIFLDLKKPIHITKKNGQWLNGDIINISITYFEIQEFKRGYMLIFYDDILDIEIYTKEVKRNEL